MKKTFALMSGETILEKSEHRNELSHKRDQIISMGQRDVYITTFLGAVEINEETGRIESTKIEEGDKL